jgi:mono/diheme cytochrome c family protein
MNRFSLCLLAMPALLAAQSAPATPEQVEFFESKIRPVLAQQCFACHTTAQTANLRLDSRDDILKGGKSGPAIVPGDPDKSVLISRITAPSDDQRMPRGGTRLTDLQIADFKKWVKDGAPWPPDEAPKHAGSGYRITASQRKFWSLQPLAHPEPPQVKDRAWAKNEIDRFIMARLEKEGLKAGPLADRRTLIRRLTYDLTGLPPTLEEVQAFEADKSPNAYEKVVDRLLASQHYGEMWARRWLDVVRYSDDDYNVTHNPDRIEHYPFAYTYRDWVIRSLNEDMPFDFFVKSQLAGDQLDESLRVKTVAGLGMNGLGVWAFNDSPPAIERSDEWNDKVDVTTKAFLGLTVGCARCHDHKYDPIPTKDYYSLASVFASSSYHAYPLAPKAQVDEYDKRKKEQEDQEKALKTFIDQATEMNAQTLFAQTEDYMLAAWKVGDDKHATVASVADAAKLDNEVLERWVRFLKKPPSNYAYLKPWQEMVANHGKEDQAKKLAHEFYLKAVEIDKLHAKVKEDSDAQLAKFKANEKFDELPNGKKRNLIQHQIDLKSLDREQSYLWTDMFDTDLIDNTPDLAAYDKKEPGLLKFVDFGLEKRLSTGFAAYIVKQRAEIEEAKKSMTPYPFVYGLADGPEPVDLDVFLRGSPYSFGEPAPRAFLSIFSETEPQKFTKGSGRLELAEAIVKQPISARVIVNRIWRWNMGTGLVETPSNFGLMGERPSNPELLEYLTSRFVSEGMSWKKLTKEIVMSRTYQLSSDAVEGNATKDPENRLYWRANRRRMEAEGIWDSLLLAAGKLDLSKIGGPSEDLTEGMKRRGMYGSVSRVYPSAFQVAFDFPTATLSAERRYTTNVPQQRLFFLNNPFVSSAAAAMADRAKDAGNDEAQVRKAFLIAYQRDPTPQELAAALEFFHAAPANSATADSPSVARSSLAAKPAPGSETVAASAPAARAQQDSPLKSLCWGLLSTNEFLYQY